jgi:hypothetical protein
MRMSVDQDDEVKKNGARLATFPAVGVLFALPRLASDTIAPRIFSPACQGPRPIRKRI